jgi:hypothetical protein
MVHGGGLGCPNIFMVGDWAWLSHRSETQAVAKSSWLFNLANQGVRMAVIETGAGTSIPSVRHSLNRCFEA